MKKNDDRNIVQKKDEEITNKILFVFSITLLILLAVIFINRYMNSTAYFNTLTFCTVATIVIAVAGVGLIIAAFIKRAVKTADQLDKHLMLTGMIALIVSVVLLFIRLLTFRSFTILYTALPVFAFLYMILNIYQRDFFYQTIVVGCTAGTLYAFSRWLHYKPWKPIVHITYSVAILLLIAAILLTIYLRNQKGMLSKIRMLSHSANYKLMISTFAAMLLTIVVVLIVGSGIAFWTMVGVLGYLFVLAVYYTIRLM